ncbi:hypothetical protein MVEN_00952000 [Mycena venus]|uniref:Uncharacterized protein n=1 Tax=Mycena venus TaxID=2733690 RepID=A0A8H6YCH6_9AGAR|nr:hypothetical protein MVEN_00952000 [Mycena venus]
MANTASEEPASSDFAFTLDGVPQEPFTHRPDNTSDFIYQQSVFNVSGLDRGEHTVVMSTNNAAGSLMLFDYATYIFDDGVVPSLASTATVTSTITSTSQARRQRARYAKELEETRVHSPEVEWVQFHDPELQGWRAVMGTRKEGRISAPGGRPSGVVAYADISDF